MIPHKNWLNAPLAIVGMACRLPGADGLAQYWDLLQHGRYPIERMPDAKLDRQLYYHPEKGKRGRTYSDIGGFVEPRELDWSLLNITPEEAPQWDPCHLNFCEVAARACVHAGYDPRHMRQRNVGVFVGHSGGTTLGGELAYRTLAQDYVELLQSLESWPQAGSHALQQQLLQRLVEKRPVRHDGRPWVEAGFVAGVVSRLLGLNGPHLAIDAACASSLVALALGAMSIHSGQTEMAIVGGASFNKSDSLILFSHAQSCSATASRPFDERADGLISSEGYVALVIKSLARAQADGDTIQAVVHGIGLATDGRGKSLWAPRKEGQYAAIERAYSDQVPPASVQMVEAHATSTHLGDATEMEALASFYAQHLPAGTKLPVGSVKSNIGHTLETAGLAGVVKAVLSIQNGLIPPTINVEQPSRSIPWADIPLRIAQRAEVWPQLAQGMPRRAAVNAFGIGGLNVHVVIEQCPAPSPSTPGEILSPRLTSASPWRPPAFEPVAIIGRGCVLPGALHIAALECLLRQPPPPTHDSLRRTIDDFHYDWRKHKVPPKQIAQANPLQFMLLEAAEQALTEAGLLERPVDRQHTAVVVGSVFGGDFGNSLYAGLRLPELQQILFGLLREQGVVNEQALRVVQEFESLFLKTYPALLDETGSFTSSTLASRLSKTFDLMGGALAVDAGDCSGSAALQSACQLLHSGVARLVLCAGAQRALDRAALENLSQLKRLPGCGRGAEGYAVGEGVALVLLKPLAAARRDGDRILATIDGMGCGFDPHSLSNSTACAMRRLGSTHAPHKAVGGIGIAHLDQAVSTASGTLQLSTNLPFTGHLHAAQSLVDLISVSLNSESEPTLIASHAQSGQSFLVAASPASVLHHSEQSTAHTLQPQSEDRALVSALPPTVKDLTPITAPSTAAAHAHSALVKSTEVAPPELFRFSSSTLELLREQLTRIASAEALGNELVVERFSSHPSWRAVIVCHRDELALQARKLLALLGNAQALPTAADQGLLWRAPIEAGTPKSRVAWLFPGQGSQYYRMLQDLSLHEPIAARALAEANAALLSLGQPTFERLAWSEQHQLGEDVWQTQAAMLVADWIMYQTLRGLGLSCDVVSGHSYGEIPAMLAAGCWTLTDALQATWQRCRAISHHARPGCAMLSVQADAAAVEQILQATHSLLTISHRNAPNQTVVGGKQAQIAQLAQQLEEAGITSRILPVPTAFHTAALDAAQPAFRQALQSIAIHPPRTPLLSSVDNRFIADPAFIRDGLARQLSMPLDFVSLVDRLVEDGVNLAIEVGPQQVLTRLVRQSTDQLFIIPSDHTKHGARHQLRIVEGIAELYDLKPLPDLAAEVRQSVSGSGTRRTTPSSVLHFDATQARKARMRSEGRGENSVQSHSSLNQSRTSLLHFDATEPRRTQHRDASALGISQTHATPQFTPQVGACAEEALEIGDRWGQMPPASQLTQPQLSVASGNSNTAIETFLIDFVVEQTGYPADIIELDWDIEADLGIDSIKKAQLFGELREFFDLESHTGFKLDDYRTLRDIALLLQRTPGKTDWLLNASMAEKTQVSAEAEFVPHMPIELAAIPAMPVVSASTGQHSVADLTAILIDFVVEQTGYPAEIVELDADLEADLGIDSIKKAQLFGELRELFSIQPTQWSGQASNMAQASGPGIADFRNLRQILNWLVAHAQCGEPALQAPLTQLSDDDSVTRQMLRPAIATSTLATLDLRQGYVDTDGCFSAALHSNVYAMIARRERGRSGDSPTNGQWSTYQIRTQQLAEGSGVPLPSLQALERELLGAARWKLLNTPDSDCLAQAATEAGEISWLAGLNVPGWLTSGGGIPLGLTVQQSGDVELTTPGSIAPLASLKGSVLCVAGVDRNTPVAAVRYLSAAIAELPHADLETLVELAQGWAIPGAWWLMLAHADRLKVTVLKVCDNGFQVQTSDVKDFGYGSQPETTWNNQPLSATLGLNRQLGQFVVRCQLQPRPHLPVQTELPQAVGETSRFSDVSNKYGNESGLESGNTPVVHTVDTITHRYILRMVPSQQPTAKGRQPNWAGTAVIVGDNPVARQLEARCHGAGVHVVRWAASHDPYELAQRFAHLIQDRQVPHLFLLTPCDTGAEFSLEPSAWDVRRHAGILGNFWLCQKWLEHITCTGLADDASLMAVSTLGGDFGIQRPIYSAEGGGVGGLLKSILIEGWMQGFRSLPIKTLDTSRDQSPAEIVEALWRELANPSYDNEIAIIEGNRHVVRAVRRPLGQPMSPGQRSSTQLRKISRGGTWVCTGGARGITAYVAEKLALRYGLTLHLLGTAPAPHIDPDWRDLDAAQLRQLKAQVMTSARNAGLNPVKTWQVTEKGLEIDATLRRMASLGIDVRYHRCDVSDRASVMETLQHVRATSGPIHGVLHGAGVGKDARFDRKQADKVEQCIAAKVDGALALMAATMQDPLECFIGFGSISGRFGANGHTDYSLANDMLCKTIDGLRNLRPEVRAIGFHWHAWGDVGMATKPETRLALEMIDMQFMPAEEGVRHLVGELESDTLESEVLITDDRYYRMFYPAETLMLGKSSDGSTDLLTPLVKPLVKVGEGHQPRKSAQVYVASVNPVKDPFLMEHRLDDRPLMPFVVAAEMLLEAGLDRLQTDVVMLRDMVAHTALRFFHDAPQELRIETEQASPAQVDCRLVSAFLARDGRVVDPHRINFTAQVAVCHGPADEQASQLTHIAVPANALQQPVVYPASGSKFFVGWPLQRLKKVALVERGIVGAISAPALIELAGGGRDVRGWRIPSAALDACLFAVGILAWQQVAPGAALPVRMGQLRLGRLPNPGEACQVHARLSSAAEHFATFDFTLYGIDGSLLIDVRNYEVAWVAQPQQADSDPSRLRHLQHPIATPHSNERG